MHYLWWIPLACLYYVGYAWLSQKNNVAGNLSWAITLYLYGGLIQLWVIVSRVSKNLLFDGILYDFIMVSSFAIAIAIMTGTKLSVQQILGITLSIIGLILIRV